ncbi:MAG: ABC transporter substrate-binding protein [Clostridia bacterium]|nr:ABC transporter substrate-binding protein [Clostridia bacterium]
MGSCRYKLLGLALLALFLVTVVAGCGGGAPATKEGEKPAAKPIRVGVIDTYTGPATTYTMDALDGFKLALKEVNEKGVLGTKIEFLQRDEQFKVDVAQNWAKELVMRENVDLLAGTINSAAALAVSEFAKENKVPFLVWGAMSEKITGAAGHRYVFSMLPNTAMSGRAGAVQMSKMPYTKYWLAGSDYEYGHSIINNFWDNLKRLKPDVQKLGETWWRVGEPDFTPYINAIRAAKPEVLVVGTGGADMVPFLKAVKATGLSKDVQVWVHTATDLSTLRPLGAEAPEGVLGTNPYHYYYPDTPENKAFVEAFRKEYNREPAAFALYGYLAGKFIAAAYEKAGAVDREKFIDALEGLTIDSPVGKVTVRKEDHQVVMPMFFGKTAKDPNLPYLVAKDITALSGTEIMPPIEEIMKKREGK